MSCVDFSVIFITVHALSPIAIKSPTLKGFDVRIEKEAKRSLKTFCKAKAIAIPQIPKLANNGVIFTPILSNNNNHHIIHIITLAIN